MKKLNVFNRVLIIVMVVLLLSLVYKILSYKQWERYYYTENVSNPEEFPIHLFWVTFLMPDGDYGKSFSEDTRKINSFYSNWGEGEYGNSDRLERLPARLFLEYVDFRTKEYYADTVALPKEKMVEIFKEAKEGQKLKDLHYWSRAMGLNYHVGIANEGNIVIWLIGKNYEREVYRTQLKPKPFPDKLLSFSTLVIQNKEEFIDDLFKDIPDSIKTDIMKLDVSHMQYKDSIPVYFRNMHK